MENTKTWTVNNKNTTTTNNDDVDQQNSSSTTTTQYGALRIGNRTTSSSLRSDTGVLKPMDYLNRQEQKRKRLLLILIGIFLFLFGAIIAWRIRLEVFQHKQKKKYQTSSSSSSNENNRYSYDDDDFGYDNNDNNATPPSPQQDNNNSNNGNTTPTNQNNSQPHNNNNNNDSSNTDDDYYYYEENHFDSKPPSTHEKALQYLNSKTSHNSNIESGCESTILILRHCDKYGKETRDEYGNEHCSYLGYQRTAYIPTLFEGYNNNNSNTTGTTNQQEQAHIKARYPKPSKLYALTYERHSHNNYREYQTLIPLSKQTNINIEVISEQNITSFVKNTYFPMLQNGELCNKIIVICWKHSYIPDLANTLGCGPDNGCPSSYPEYSFDQIWQIKYVYDPPLIRTGSINVIKNNDNDKTSVQEVIEQEDKTTSSTTIPITTPATRRGRRNLKNTAASTTSHHNDKHTSDGKETTTTSSDNGKSKQQQQQADDVNSKKTTSDDNEKNKNNDKDNNKFWSVYGYVTSQNFDPLSHSYSVGDYNNNGGGSRSGGNWRNEL